LRKVANEQTDKQRQLHILCTVTEVITNKKYTKYKALTKTNLKTNKVTVHNCGTSTQYSTQWLQ